MVSGMLHSNSALSWNGCAPENDHCMLHGKKVHQRFTSQCSRLSYVILFSGSPFLKISHWCPYIQRLRVTVPKAGQGLSWGWWKLWILDGDPQDFARNFQVFSKTSVIDIFGEPWRNSIDQPHLRPIKIAFNCRPHISIHFHISPSPRWPFLGCSPRYTAASPTHNAVDMEIGWTASSRCFSWRCHGRNDHGYHDVMVLTRREPPYSLEMFIDVCNVYRCLMMFIDVYRCLMMFIDVYRCIGYNL